MYSIAQSSPQNTNINSVYSPLNKLITACTLVAFICSGCAYLASWNEVSDSWLGQPVSKFIQMNGEPASVTPVRDGANEYKFNLKKLDPSCIHWWIVNKEGVIVGYRHEGYCRPIG